MMPPRKRAALEAFYRALSLSSSLHVWRELRLAPANPVAIQPVIRHVLRDNFAGYDLIRSPDYAYPALIGLFDVVGRVSGDAEVSEAFRVAYSIGFAPRMAEDDFSRWANGYKILALKMADGHEYPWLTPSIRAALANWATYDRRESWAAQLISRKSDDPWDVHLLRSLKDPVSPVTGLFGDLHEAMVRTDAAETLDDLKAIGSGILLEEIGRDAGRALAPFGRFRPLRAPQVEIPGTGSGLD